MRPDRLTMIPHFNAADVKAFFSRNVFERADALWKAGRVLEAEEVEDGVAGVVRGDRGERLEQTISVVSTASSFIVEGDCACDVQFNCKHVAAVLLEYLAQRGKGPSAVAASRTVNPAAKAAAPPAAKLPDSIVRWLDELERAGLQDSDEYPPDVATRLLYIFALAPIPGAGPPELALSMLTTRVLKNGAYSTTTHPFQPERMMRDPPQYLRPADHRVARALGIHPYDSSRVQPALNRGNALEVVEAVVATGRAHWRDMAGPILRMGEPLSARVSWRFLEKAEMRPVIEAPDGVLAFVANPPLYVKPAEGLIGACDLGIPGAQAFALLKGPPTPARYLKAIGDAMAKRSPRLAAVAPSEPEPPIVVEVAPRPVLRFNVAHVPASGGGYWASHETLPLARLSFFYDDLEATLADEDPVLTRLRDRRLHEFRRDAVKEQAALAAVQAAGLEFARQRRRNLPKPHQFDLVPGPGGDGWLGFLHLRAPELRAAGIEIEIDPEFPFHVLDGGGEIAAEIEESSGIDWLEFGLGAMIDGERIDLIEPIVGMIERGFSLDAKAAGSERPVYVPLGGGRYIAIPASRFEPILKAIYDLASGGAPERGRFRITRAEAMGLAEMEAAGAALIWRGGERLREMGRKLGAAGGIPDAPTPPEFTATLRPYQARGVAWLAFLRDVGLGGILADDMGLGKTVQALALIAIEKAAGRLDAPALVVAPTSLMANWRREAEKFAPNLRVLTLQVADRKSRFDAIAESDIVLTTYPLMSRDSEIYAARKWHLLLLDEAQTIKNPDANTTKLIRGLDARHRFCLTGTPLENHLGELWSLFAFASPGFLGDRAHFTKHWRTPIEKKGNGERAKLLARRVRPFILRRSKAEVAPELPTKTEIIERVEMQPPQRDVYESIRLAMHERVRAAIAEKGFARSHIVILDALLKLRQACCDPRLLKLKASGADRAGSAKLERLLELLDELVQEGRKIIIFSQFTSMLALIEQSLKTAGYPYALLTGDTRDREGAIEKFRRADTPIFLISLKAGGTGLNLTEADTIVLYDPWWNPAVEEQAIDRAHRIGQDKPVFVHKLIATGTIEEKMDVLKEKKRGLARGLFDADGAPTEAMTEADLAVLFEEA